MLEMAFCYVDTFSNIYAKLLTELLNHKVTFICNKSKMLYEILNINLHIKMCDNNISIYSSELTKALPIGFTLAEFLTLLTDNQDITHLCIMNKNMLNYAEYTSIGEEVGTTKYYTPHYGVRLYNQLPKLLTLLQNDKYTRQACASIWKADELNLNNKSCNVFLQFIIRNNKLNLIVISRSSDFFTGLQIDAFHWQALLILFYNELKQSYPNLHIGSVIYKITSLHVYEKDKFIFDNIQNNMLSTHTKYQIYSHNLPLYNTFSSLRDRASKVTDCRLITELCQLYNFKEKQLNVIDKLRYIYKNRIHIVQR